MKEYMFSFNVYIDIPVQAESDDDAIKKIDAILDLPDEELTKYIVWDTFESAIPNTLNSNELIVGYYDSDC